MSQPTAPVVLELNFESIAMYSLVILPKFKLKEMLGRPLSPPAME